ncbi:MAG: carboxypeptidase-like regulatory domain-containing protein [Candidatus Cryptobacteroides sp.]
MLCIIMQGIVFGQGRTAVCGYVSDGTSGESLLGALVSASNGNWTVTNSYGYYSLPLPEGDYQISCSFVGYEMRTVNVTVSRVERIDFAMSSSEELESAILTEQRPTGLRSIHSGVVELSMDDVSKMPVLLGEADILKSLQQTPGVQGGVEGLSGIFVRGGGQDENLFLYDGVPMYNVSHLFGVFSAFSPEAVKKATFYKGSFPARFGGRLSSVLDIRSNDGDLYATHGSVGVGLLNSHFHIEGPLSAGKASYSVSARGMHTALFAPIIQLAKADFNYWFYDINAKFFWKVTDKDRLYFTLYNGLDHFRFAEKGDYYAEPPITSDVSMNMNWGNLVGAVRWNRIYGNSLHSDIAVAYNGYEMRHSNGTVPTENAPDDIMYGYFSETGSAIRDVLFTSDFSLKARPDIDVTFGAFFTWHHFAPTNRYLKTDRDGGELMQNGSIKEYKGIETGVYAECDWRPVDWFEMNAGFRMSVMTGEGRPYYSPEPRISIRIPVPGGFSFKTSYARNSQYVHLLSSSTLYLPTDLWVPVTKDVRPMVSDQIAAGVYCDRIPGWEFSVEGYWKKQKNVMEYKDGVAFFGSAEGWEDSVSQGEGRSYGVEFHAAKEMGNTTGTVNYTISKTERRFPDGSVNNGMWFPFRYDRRHNVFIGVSHRFNERIDLNASWSFLSGGLVSLPDAASFIIGTDDSQYQYDPDSYHKLKPMILPSNHYSSRNNFRLPPSHRLDVSANFKKIIKHGESIWTVGIYNIYCSMNPNLILIRNKNYGQQIYDENAIELQKITVLPILPYFSYKFKF